MRVLVACDRIGALDSWDVGVALASGFRSRAQVAVAPVAAGGPDLAAAFGHLVDAPVHSDGERWTVRTDGRVLLGHAQPGSGWSPKRSSADFGTWVAAELADEDEVILDLTGLSAHDGGAGLLETAGAALAGRRVVGVVDPEELTLPAAGIGGGLAKRAFASGVDVAELLAADARLTAWAADHGEGLDKAPGSGAAGTTALAILALGGELVGATQFCHREAQLERTLAAADLVVTACADLSALDRGGPVVSAISGWAEEVLRPLVLFTTGFGLSRRELRTMGIESAHILTSPQPSADDLTAAAARIAAGWVTG